MGGFSRSSVDSAVTVSVIDRLIDEDPRTGVEALPTRSQSVRLLKDGVRRDLEWLLNTRRIAVEPDPALHEVDRSVYMYGLPDFTAMSLASPKDQAKLLRSLQGTIKQFEPRLASVRIVPLELQGVNTRTLRFRIEGLLLMDPAPEHVSFDTVLDLTSSQYVVRGEANAG
jgi:type VI secretion system protein ImpF